MEKRNSGGQANWMNKRERGTALEKDGVKEGGERGRGTIKTHLYAGQFVITILVGAGP